ncbi:uncharacterized protein LOC129286886 [Prosopis cineraria]|uniref:uncharacterized protein LOC129286886 n=1 Tax=Prosopis cineraria TaxID=364024 RepID=UPI00240F3DE0|nr:uncharacterized protein LOC129286886 [Prosopis cineraria]
MAQVLNLSPPFPTKTKSLFLSSDTSCSTSAHQSWSSLQHKLQCNGRFLCLFSDNKREEEARRALEGALSGKKNEFEKWNKEIKRREDLGGGGDAGGGGWFGRGGWFGWSNDDKFWQEAKQASLTLLGILLIYLIVAKGELLLAVILNPLLYALRGTRNGFSFITSKILKITNGGNQTSFDGILKKEDYQRPSAKENVIRKWGSD